MVVIRPLEHTGDVGFEVEADDLIELFAAAKRALLELLLARPPKLAQRQAMPVSSRVLELSAADLETLLVRWLDELLFLVQGEGLVPLTGDDAGLHDAGLHDAGLGDAGLRIWRDENASGSGGGWRLHADLLVTPLDLDAQGWQGEVKGTTYHGLEVARRGERWHARVVLDV